MKFIIKIICGLILISDDKPSFAEKLQYLLALMAAFGPVAYLLDILNVWFVDNKGFATGVFFCYLMNMAVGWWYHLKMKTFSWTEFFHKNGLMLLALIVIYALLEILRSVLGQNIGAEAFKIVIQVATLIWPISKACKNIYILTDGQHPPKFIMEKLYNFEKTGDVSELFKKENNIKKGME